MPLAIFSYTLYDMRDDICKEQARFMQQNQSYRATSTSEETEDMMPDEPTPKLSDLPADPPVQRVARFDWPAVGIVAIIAAIFAVLAHLSAQPAASLAPVAVLSGTGCGLLITGLRKLRTFKGAGLFEAALSGLLMALFQFLSALSFSGVIHSLSTDPLSQPGFFTTWGLVAIFATLFSIIGATLGHLIFAPLRPLPAKATKRGTRASITNTNDEDEQENAPESNEDLSETSHQENEPEEDEELAPVNAAEAVFEEIQPARSTMSYIVPIVLLGLAPFLAGYVFAAAFDVALNFNHYDPGPFPTLRLLSTLLPWQIPLPINLQTLNMTLAWRIPFLPGNPGAFDVQAIEPFLLNAAGLACTLLALFRLEQRTGQAQSRHSLGGLLFLEALLGLVLVLPADLWIAYGLHGLLQLPTISVPIRTLELLNTLTFALNLITAPLVCLVVGMAIVGLRRKAR